jgi:hypothetical protein
VVIVINKWPYIRVDLYSGGLIFGGAYIWNEVSVSTCGGLIHGGLIFGGGLYSEVYGILQALYYKLKLFTNAKDKVPKQNKSNVVYEFTCPKCNNSYMGKTDRTLLERVKEHAYTKTRKVLCTNT